MSAIDKKTVEHIARLSKIKLSEAEKERLIPELNNILSLVGELQKINTDGVEPLMSVLEVALPPDQQPAQLPCHDDRAVDKNESTALLNIAPAKQEVGEGGFFVVPKVVGGE